MPKLEDAFSPNNPAIVLLRHLREDEDSRKAIAARLGTTNTELDEESFLRVALEFEPPKGKA